MEDDRLFLIHAIKLAKEGIHLGGGPFGAVIVREGKILTEAVNRVVASSDPTAHAEIIAIRQAAEILKSHELENCILYCTCEPCPMCLGAIYWSGIKKVVYACSREDAARAGFADSEIYDEIILEPAARKISFVRVENTDGEDVFRKWDEYETRITY